MLCNQGTFGPGTRLSTGNTFCVVTSNTLPGLQKSETILSKLLCKGTFEQDLYKSVSAEHIWYSCSCYRSNETEFRSLVIVNPLRKQSNGPATQNDNMSRVRLAVLLRTMKES